MYQAQIPIGNNFPVNLVLLSNGTLVFVRVANVGVLVDQAPKDGVEALFTDNGFTIGNEELWYNTIYRYKEKPEMLKWLQQQNLIQPV